MKLICFFWKDFLKTGKTVPYVCAKQLLYSMKICISKPVFTFFLLLALLLTDCYTAQAQYRRRKFNPALRYTNIGIMACGTSYFGDLAPRPSVLSSDILKFSRPNFGFFISRKVSPHVNLRGSLAFGQMAGDDFKSQKETDGSARYRYIRNLSFRNNFQEVAFTASYELFGNRKLYNRRAIINPYVFIGVAAFHHNPQARFPGESWVNLQPLGTEGQGIDGKKRYSLFQVAIPYGAGVKFRVAARFDLAFEIGLRQTFTDYLDDVSGNYPDEDILAQMSPEAVRFSNRSISPVSSTGEARNLDAVAIPLYGPSYQTVYGNGLAVNGHGIDGAGNGEQRGNPKEKDQYWTYGFHFSYIIFRGVRCPKF